MRVMLIGDGMRLTSGFAQVLRHVAAALVGRGDDVAQITCLDSPPFCRSEDYHALGVEPYFPAVDGMGFDMLVPALKHFSPDRIFLNMDPGSAWSWIYRLQNLGVTTPRVLYAPVEGGPPAKMFCEVFAARDQHTVLYTQWAADQVRERTGTCYPWVWHGVDRSVWHPLDTAERDAKREALGWTDRFVVSYVGRNAERKAHDVLVEALPALIERVPNVMLYLHCDPHDAQSLHGWDLDALAQDLQVADHVEFPGIAHSLMGVEGYRLANVLACTDLYCHPAEIEGFGLPLVEAMATELPLVTVADGGNMDEVVGGAPAIRIAPRPWRRRWFTGAKRAETDPEQWAEAIACVAKVDLAPARARSRDRATAFSWDVMTDRLIRELDCAEEPMREAVAADG